MEFPSPSHSVAHQQYAEVVDAVGGYVSPAYDQGPGAPVGYYYSQYPTQYGVPQSQLQPSPHQHPSVMMYSGPYGGGIQACTLPCVPIGKGFMTVRRSSIKGVNQKLLSASSNEATG